MTRYTHPDLEGFLSPAKFQLPDGRKFPASWFRTSTPKEITALGFVEYVPPEPEPVEPSTDPADYPLTPAQFKALVTYLGKDAEIRSAIGQIPDDMNRAWSLSRYENATVYLWSDPLLHQVRAVIGMDEQTLENAWMLAKDLRSVE